MRVLTAAADVAILIIVAFHAHWSVTLALAVLFLHAEIVSGAIPRKP